MQRIRLDIYAAVAATLALAVALGGSSYAVARHATAPAKGGGGNTAPMLVISVAANGHIKGQVHRAPMTGKAKVKRPVPGIYVFTLPGVKYNDIHDAAVCSAQNGDPMIAMADGAGNSQLAIDTRPADGSNKFVNSDFKCAVWNLDGM